MTCKWQSIYVPLPHAVSFFLKLQLNLYLFPRVTLRAPSAVAAHKEPSEGVRGVHAHSRAGAPSPGSLNALNSPTVCRSPLCSCGEPETALHLRSSPVLMGQLLLDTSSRQEGHST